MRLRRLAKNIGGAVLGRGINLIAAFLTVPIALGGLGQREYGVFAVLLSISTFFTYADLGLGFAVVNRIASGSAPEGDSLQRLVTRVFAFLVSMALISISLCVILYVALMLSGLSSLSVWGAPSRAWLLLVMSAAVALPTGLAQRILFASQLNFQAALWNAGSRIAALAAVYFVAMRRSDISSYVLAMMLVPAFISWLSLIHVFFRTRSDLRPSIQRIDLKKLAIDGKLGLQFTVLQLATYAETGLDLILISRIIGYGPVAAFDVTARLYNYIPALISIGSLPLWPAVANAISTGDKHWAVSLSKRAVGLTAVCAGSVALGLYIFQDAVVSEWARRDLPLPPFTGGGLAVLAILISIAQVQANLIAGFGNIRFLTRVQYLAITALVMVKIGALTFMGIGPMVWLTCLTYFPRIYMCHRQLQREVG